MEPRAGEHSLAFVMWKQNVYHTDDVVRNTVEIFERILPNCARFSTTGKCYDPSTEKPTMEGK
jgi:hypothetical protein